MTCLNLHQIGKLRQVFNGILPACAEGTQGRKRHLLVDTLGLVINAYVWPANLQDRDSLKEILNRYFDTGVTRLRKLWVNGGYRGEDLKKWVAEWL